MAEKDTEKALPEEIPAEFPEATIEAILFAAGHPVSYEKLAEAMHYSESDVRRIVQSMIETYDHRGFFLLAFDDTCQLATREQYLPYVRSALGIKRGGNLSQSSMEVLAIVAYNQPVTRAFIDAVRGVDSSYAVTSLLEKDLLAVSGHLDAPGRPSLLCTTDKFLRVFGLSSISELPPAEQLIMAPEAQEEQLSILSTESAESAETAEETAEQTTEA